MSISSKKYRLQVLRIILALPLLFMDRRAQGFMPNFAFWRIGTTLPQSCEELATTGVSTDGNQVLYVSNNLAMLGMAAG